MSEYETLLVAGTVPEGEGDMGYFAEQSNVVPHFIPEMSREISLKDFATIWKIYRLFLRERPDHDGDVSSAVPRVNSRCTRPSRSASARCLPPPRVVEKTR